MDSEQQPKSHQPSDKSNWPEGVASIGWDAIGELGVDAKGALYWRGKPVEIRRPLDLTLWQKIGTAVVATATVIAAFGAVAQGFAAYNDWACKVGWRSAACPAPAPAQTAPPPAEPSVHRAINRSELMRLLQRH